MTLLISVGELSGDVYASKIIKEIHRRHPQWRIAVLGGNLSRKAGAELLADTVSLATFGLWELLATLRRWKGVWDASRRWIMENQPNLVIIIDNPGFNLRLGRFCYQRGVPVICFVPPQVWAWGAKRARTLAQVTERILTLFPWEGAHFTRWEGRAEWVGHPLTRLVPELAYFTDPSHREKIVFLPGSRRRELLAFLRVLAPLLPALAKRWKGMEMAMVLSNPDFREIITRILPAHPLTLYEHGSRYEALRGARLCMTTCGTVTLEVAFAGIPQIIVYRVSALTYRIGRLLLKQRFFGLPNIIMGREVAPELIQHTFTVQNALRAMEGILEDRDQRQQEAWRLATELRETLSFGDPFDNVVRVIEELYDE
ncbi:MAG TPA: lipid-A-disaccharide synthase [Atribacteraceae bacterium]|nr:lipid-A-disaccharide synthase [Atribacteraceae bacterium]